jgi:hypothetical protein
MRHIAAISILFIAWFATGCKHPKANALSNKSIDSIKRIALADYKNKRLKYYYHSIASPSVKLCDYLKGRCGITVISKNDFADEKKAYYNTVSDSIIFKKTGKKLEELVKQF